MTAPLSTRLATRASAIVDRRSSRRGFLRKTAMVGTAMAVAPVDYALRPGTAYAAICQCSGSSCDCGAQCCDGYTEFCCTLNGANGCPPGTLYGGWWKADGSGFCATLSGQQGPRYYLDCNAPCGNCGCGASGICSGSCSGTPCGCGNGSCNNRKAGCTGFRYGQCNQNIPCIGPIVCRVVTCTPPWEIDQTCTTAQRTDNNTRSHNAACLQGDPGGPTGRVESVRLTPGGVRVDGYVFDNQPKNVRLSAGLDTVADIVANKTAADLGYAEPSGRKVVWFSGVIASPLGRQVICASVIDNGRLRSIGCSQLVVPNHKPFGELDSAFAGPGFIRVNGWAIDPDSAKPVKIRVSVDDKFLDEGRARKSRPDVEAIYPDFGDQHGFSIKVPLDTENLDKRKVKVCVYAVNRGEGRGRTLLGCVNVPIHAGSPFGSLDRVENVPTGVLVKGWAIEPDIAGPVTIRIQVDGSTVANLQANKGQRAVAELYPGYGRRHGFSEIINVAPGTHEICVRATNTGKGRGKIIGCLTVTVPQ